MAKSQIAAQQANDKLILERGVIGKVFGSKDHAPYYIVAIIIIICILLMTYIMIFSGGYAQNKEALSFIGNFVTLGMGYIFGKSTS
ncbi:hypothetical protein [uncultured Sphingomonas sp.]|uniref:hypothetical protein n=1 Tax=uncultured Sphingomonas sp. TaxID=158754 RepID=UPI003749AB46